MAGTLVKTIEASLIVNAGDAKEQLDDLTAKAERLKKPWEIDITALTGEAQGAVDDVTKALIDYNDAAIKAEEASAKLAKVQGDDTASADELSAAMDRVAETTVRSIDAQLRLAGAEERAAAAAVKTGDETEIMGDKQLTAGKKGEEGAGFLAGAAEKAKLAMLGVTVGLGYGTIEAAKFQARITMLNTQAGVSKKQLGELGSGVLTLAGQVGENPDSLAESLYHVESNMASLGISAPRALSLVKVAAEGARIGGADLVDVTNALTAAVASNIPGVKNFSQAMGMLNATVGAGDMTMQDLADAFGGGMVAVVKGYGLSLKDVGAALATFGDNNIRGAKAGTDLRMAVQALAVPLKTAPLAEFGLKANTLAKDMEKGGLIKALDDLTERFHKAGLTGKTEGEAITAIFGKKAGAGVAVLLEQMDRLRSKYPQITKGANDFGSAWATTQKNVSQQMRELEDGSQALAIRLGEKLLPAGLKVVHWLTNFVQDLNEGKAPALALASAVGAVLAGVALEKLAGGIKTAEQGFELLWGGMKKGVDFVAWFGNSFVSLWGKMRGATVATEEQTVATEELTVAQEGADVAMEANPIGAIITLLLLLGGAIYEVVKHWKDFKQWGLDAWHWVDNAAHKAFDWLKQHWPLVLGILTGPIGLAVYFIKEHWQEIVTGAEDAIHAVGSWFGRLPGMILGWVKDFGNLLFTAGADLLHGLIHGIESVVSDVEHAVEHVGSSILHKIEGALGIGSPSKEMRLRGQFAGMGLALGLTDSIPLVEHAAQQLAAATLQGYRLSPAGGALGAAGAGGVGEIVLHLNVNQQQLFEWMQQGLVRLKRGRGFQVDTRAGLGLA